MRFVTFVDEGIEHAGILEDDRVFGLEGSATIAERLAASAPELLASGLRARKHESGVALADVRLLAPLRPPTIRDFTIFERHIEGMSMGAGAPGLPPTFYDAPRFYFSNPHAVAGPGEDVPVPPGCARFDFELEIATVIGSSGRDLDASRAREAIFGYTLFNDWSARDIAGPEMMSRLGPAKGKDTTNTLGPWLVTADELEPYRNDEGFLEIAMRVERNGELMGEDNLANGSWTLEELIVIASRGTWVRPGDVIGSGTCGAGCLAERWAREGAQAPRPLLPGDEVVLSATALGELRNRVVAGVEQVPVPRGRVHLDRYA